MKLLNLRLANLNSLYGEWSIDFEHDAYLSNGLFAITGPTGAGKSTLLDAISLALYGRTPRLGTITNSTNDIMSRDCGECFAEVTFQSSKGKFRAHWSQRRARSKADGNLQSPQHELIDVDTQQVLTAKKSETQAIIQDNVGLDYEQFMRSIMLAQGEFATFLKSEDSKRASILAKITGTDIYARIGIAVYQRFRSETESFDFIAAQSSAIELLSDEAIAELKTSLEKIDATLDKLNEDRKAIDLAIRWLERFEELNREVASLDEERKKKTLAVDAAFSLRTLLEKAQRASAFQRSLDGLHSLQSRTVAADKLLEEIKAELADLEAFKTKTLAGLETSKKDFSESQAKIEASRPIWMATHDLDLQIGYATTNLEKTRSQSESIDTTYKKLQQEKLDLESKSKEAGHKLAQARSYLAEHSFDAELVGLLPKIEHLVSEHRSTIKQLRDVESNLASVSDRLSLVKLDRSDADERLLLVSRTVTDGQAEIDAIEKRRLANLQGELVADLQSAVDAIRRIRQAVIEQVHSLETILSLEGEKASKFKEHHELNHALLKSQETRTTIEKLIDQQTQLVSALETSYFKDQLIAELHQHRSRLIAGQPCELCGSTEHPWADGATLPVTGGASEALSRAKEELAQFLRKQEESNRLNDRHLHLLSQASEALSGLTESIDAARLNFAKHASLHKLDPIIGSEPLASAKKTIEEHTERESMLVIRLQEANSLLEIVAKTQGEMTRILIDKATAEQAAQSLANAQQNLEEAQERTKGEIVKYRESLDTKRQELEAIFERVRLPWPEDLARSVELLKTRSKAWQALEQNISGYEKEMILIEGSVVSLKTQIDQAETDMRMLQVTINTQSDELELLLRGRNELFGSQDPKEVECELQQLVQQKKIESARLAAEYEPMVAKWQLLDRQVAQMESTALADAQQLADQRMRLDVDLQASGFADVLDLEQAIKSPSTIEEWSDQLKSLDEALNAASVRLSQKEIERQEWQSKRVTDSNLDVLQQQLSEIDCSLESSRRERIEMQHRLTENQTKIDQLQTTQARLVTQQQQVQRWSLLNELIGSADGAKFRRFAQGITFELLLAYANIQLIKLTDRYLLKKGEEGLSLVVIDHYQSSRSRSAANLSGGETFLVSLALALGLSKLASQNVQIDSLFLDEGFGTLDEETLDEALHTLSNLRQEGKLVGLISHVAALKEQIPVRIEVLKGSMGRSRLRGPGVK